MMVMRSLSETIALNRHITTVIRIHSVILINLVSGQSIAPLLEELFMVLFNLQEAWKEEVEAVILEDGLRDQDLRSPVE